MSNYVGQVYRTYKEFFKSFGINYMEAMSMFVEHFGDTDVMTYSQMLSSIRDHIANDQSLDVKEIMHLQEAVRQVEAITKCEDIERSIVLHDNDLDAYYLMGIQAEDYLVVKPLTNEGNKTMEVSTSKCLVQTKTEEGVVEEEVKGNRASIKYFSHEDLDEIEETVSFPCQYTVSQLDPSVIPYKGASLFSFGDKRVLCRYKDGQVVSEEEYQDTPGSNLYMDFKGQLKQMPEKPFVKRIVPKQNYR